MNQKVIYGSRYIKIENVRLETPRLNNTKPLADAISGIIKSSKQYLK